QAAVTSPINLRQVTRFQAAGKFMVRIHFLKLLPQTDHGGRKDLVDFGHAQSTPGKPCDRQHAGDKGNDCDRRRALRDVLAIFDKKCGTSLEKLRRATLRGIVVVYTTATFGKPDTLQNNHKADLPGELILRVRSKSRRKLQPVRW